MFFGVETAVGAAASSPIRRLQRTRRPCCDTESQAASKDCRATMPALPKPFDVRMVALASTGLCTGCSHSPTLSVFGSFFPTWLPLALLGIVFAIVVRAVCIKRSWHQRLPIPVLFYAACAVIFTFGAYLVWLA